GRCRGIIVWKRYLFVQKTPSRKMATRGPLQTLGRTEGDLGLVQGFTFPLATRHIDKGLLKISFMLERQIQQPLHTFSIELLVLNLNAKAVETGLNQSQIGEGATAAQSRHGNQFLFVSKTQTLSGHAAIGTHQTARTQLDAPKPAYHQYRDTVAILAFYGLQNWTPGR